MGEFGQLLRRYRRHCRDPQSGHPLTQERLAEWLSYESGVESYSGSTISNWERGLNQIRRDDRHVLVGLIKILHQTDGIKTQQEADQLLLAGNYRPLNDDEINQMAPIWKQPHRSVDAAFPSVAEQEAALPAPTYVQLFGLEEAQAQLLAQLAAPQSPYVLVITALGGMGKTALADAAARQAIVQRKFDHVVWFSAERFEESAQKQMPGEFLFQTLVLALFQIMVPEGVPDSTPNGPLATVRSKLKHHRYLVIIDNLEDSTEINQLLHQLNALTGPSKFLLTARQHPAPNTEAFVLTLKELDLPAAVALLRYRAKTGGVTDFSHVPEEEFQEIYRIVGGHPLALRLIPRLTRFYPLPEVLAGWQEGHKGYISEVYQSVYAALWQTLRPSEKQLLQMMPLIAQVGGTARQLQFVSGLSRAEFWPALTKLVELCLIEPREIGKEQRYGIHSLTARFLEYWQRQEVETVVTVPFSHILANISYWRQTIHHLTEKQWATLDVERANILWAIQFSLRLPDEEITRSLQEDWITLSEYLLRYVERRGYTHEWLPILENLSQRLGNDLGVHCLLLNRLGELYRLNRQLDKAIEIHTYALHAAQEDEDELEVARAHFNLGTDYFLHKAYEIAYKHGETALDIFIRQGLAGREKAAALNLLGTVAQKRGNLTQSVYFLEQAAAIWRTVNQQPELVRTLNNLARTRKRQHKIAEAQQCYTEARRILPQTGSELDRVLISLSEGEMYFELKQYEKAGAIFDSIDLLYLRQSGHLFYLASILNNLGNVAFVQGDYVTADGYLQESILLWQQLGDDLELANTLARRGDVLVIQNSLEAALAVYEEVEALAAKYPHERRAIILGDEVRQETEKLRHGKGE